MRSEKIKLRFVALFLYGKKGIVLNNMFLRNSVKLFYLPMFASLSHSVIPGFFFVFCLFLLIFASIVPLLKLKNS